MPFINKAAYLNSFNNHAEAVAFENNVLSVGSEFLPDFAQRVRDKIATNADMQEYWPWLISQVPADEVD